MLNEVNNTVVRPSERNCNTYFPSYTRQEIHDRFFCGVEVTNNTNNNQWTVSNHEDNCDNIKYIKPYDYKPDKFNLYRLKDENELYIGCELEVSEGGENDDTAKEICNLINKENDNLVYYKHDGSLDNGFEIVTMPCTYEYHKTLNYKKAFERLSEFGYKSHDTSCCGLHMHVNRTFFGNNKLEQDLNISKLLYLFEKFYTEITYVARRESNRFAQRYYLEDNETVLDIYVKSKHHDRYSIINLRNKDTIEIRIYKGTLNYNTFINTIEFTKKICEFAKQIDIYNIGMVLWKDIECNFSDELKQYIEERKKIKEDKKNKEKKVTNNCMINDYYDIVGSYSRLLHQETYVPSAFRN